MLIRSCTTVVAAKPAEAVAKGVRKAPGADVYLIAAADGPIPWETLEASDAIIFGSPACTGLVSAGLKQLTAMYFHAHARRRLSINRVIDGVALSPRELECLEWAAQGKSAREIRTPAKYFPSHGGVSSRQCEDEVWRQNNLPSCSKVVRL